ncbi:hypothetical protein [Phycicoccus sp. Root101]|uniref:hypothetical protein n=1 Tax=Phycicoccus sp. Root101 TaxID=1736421 RepID=UPI000B23EFDD|nr:hypothetical protein [Phycicoccus sp. Root101]
MRGRRVSKGLTGSVVLVVAALGLSGCGSGVGLSSATLTTPPPIPGEITQTATRTAVPSPSTSTSLAGASTPSTSASAAGTSTPKATRSASAKPAASSTTALRGDEQRVTVKPAGISFAAPIELGRVDADAMLTQNAQAPAMKALAARLGVGTTELKDGLLRQTDTILVGTTVVVVMHLPYQEIPADDLLRRQLEFGSGGTVTKIRHVTTKAGPAVRASYVITSGTKTVAGDALMVRTAGGIANVSTTAASASRSAAVMTRIIRTIQATR